eukprot:3352325-Prymnesium_polylepis.1
MRTRALLSDAPRISRRASALGLAQHRVEPLRRTGRHVDEVGVEELDELLVEHADLGARVPPVLLERRREVPPLQLAQAADHRPWRSGKLGHRLCGARAPQVPHGGGCAARSCKWQTVAKAKTCCRRPRLCSAPVRWRPKLHMTTNG